MLHSPSKDMLGVNFIFYLFFAQGRKSEGDLAGSYLEYNKMVEKSHILGKRLMLGGQESAVNMAVSVCQLKT